MPGDTRPEREGGVARADGLGQLLGGIVGNVQHRLNQLLAVAAKLRDRRVVVTHHAQPLGELGQDERAHALTDLVNVHVAHQMRMAVRRQQAVNQRLQTVGFMNDDLGVFSQLFVNVHLQELRRTANAAQRILDLVRQIADQFLVGLRLVNQPLFAVLPGLLLQRQHFHDGFAGRVGLRHHDMHRHGLMVQALEPGVVAQRGKFIAARALERVRQDGRLGETFRQLRAFNGAARGAQGVFECGIGKHHAAIGAHHGHERGQQIKGLKAHSARVGEGGKDGGEGWLFQAPNFGAERAGNAGRA